MKILTDRTEWKTPFSKMRGVEFFYTDLNIATEHLHNLCLQHNIDCVLVTSFKIILYHLERDHHYLNQIPWLIPNHQGCFMEDKFFAEKWLIENNFSSYLPRTKKSDDFPYIIKTGNGIGGDRVYYVKNPLELESLPSPFHPSIIQEYIHSPYEYAHHFIAQNGRVLHEITYQHDFSDVFSSQEHYIRGVRIRNKTSSKISLPAEFESVLHQIISQLCFNGFGCFDLKLHQNKLYILEFNSRIGGSLVHYDHQLNDFKDFIGIYVNAINPSHQMNQNDTHQLAYQS